MGRLPEHPRMSSNDCRVERQDLSRGILPCAQQHASEMLDESSLSVLINFFRTLELWDREKFKC